jgi:hypothetical protein
VHAGGETSLFIIFVSEEKAGIGPSGTTAGNISLDYTYYLYNKYLWWIYSLFT